MTEITEKWARGAPAGAELDRVCAGWLNLPVVETVPYDVDHQMVVCQYERYILPNGEEGAGVTQGHHLHEHLLKNGEGAFEQRIVAPQFSTDWALAGPLLEAMGIGIVIGKKSGEQWRVSQADGWGLVIVDAPDPCLAIARACAVLVARGITREDLEDV